MIQYQNGDQFLMELDIMARRVELLKQILALPEYIVQRICVN